MHKWIEAVPTHYYGRKSLGSGEFLVPLSILYSHATLSQVPLPSLRFTCQVGTDACPGYLTERLLRGRGPVRDEVCRKHGKTTKAARRYEALLGES